jgi:choline dehydrogenase
MIDCSSMPYPVSGNTFGPALADAARTSELIFKDLRNWNSVVNLRWHCPVV